MFLDLKNIKETKEKLPISELINEEGD